MPTSDITWYRITGNIIIIGTFRLHYIMIPLFLIPGVDNPGHPFIMTVGCVAGDEESYSIFADLLDPVIDKRHGGYPKVSSVYLDDCYVSTPTIQLLF